MSLPLLSVLHLGVTFAQIPAGVPETKQLWILNVCHREPSDHHAERVLLTWGVQPNAGLLRPVDQETLTSYQPPLGAVCLEDATQTVSGFTQYGGTQLVTVRFRIQTRVAPCGLWRTV